MWFELIFIVVSISLISLVFNYYFYKKFWPAEKILEKKTGTRILLVIELAEMFVWFLVFIFLKLHVLLNHFDDQNVQVLLGCLSFFMLAPNLFFGIYIAGLWGVKYKK